MEPIQAFIRAVPEVTTGLGLVAFLFAVGAYIYNSRLSQRKALIESGPPEQRAKMLESTFRDFSVVPLENLTKDQRYDLAVKLIEERRYKFRITAMVASGVAVLLTVVSFIPGTHGDPTRRLTIRLRDGSEVVDHGTVTVNEASVPTKTVGGNGEAPFDVPKDAFAKGVTVTSEVSGYRPVPTTTLHAYPEEGVYDLHLVPETSRVVGTVMDDPVRKTPLAGVTLDFGSGLAMATTDVHGHFHVALPRRDGARVPLKLMYHGHTGFDDTVTISDEVPLTLYFSSGPSP